EVDVRGDQVVRAADVALEIAEVDVPAVVEHPPAGGSLDHWGVGQPDLEQRAVAGPQVFQAQDAGAVGEPQDGDRPTAVVLMADEHAAGEHDRCGGHRLGP